MNTSKKSSPRHLSLDQAIVLSDSRSEEFLALDQALNRLQERDPRQSQIVELKYISGLTTDETAEVLGVSSRTVEREWEFAKSWLFMQLRERDGRGDGQMEQD